MHTQNRRHRLFVALPVFALCLFISVIGGVTESRHASVASIRFEKITTEEVRTVEVAGGAVQLQPGAVLEIDDRDVRLMAGQALILADDWLSIHVGDALLTGWSGGWYVTVDAATVGVAALTTPVRIDLSDASLIVPARMQILSVREPSFITIPPHFLRSQLSVLSERIRSTALPPNFSLQDQDPLLLSLHPLRPVSAWITPLPESVSIAERLLRLTVLPLSDRLPAAVPSHITRWWADDLASVIVMREGSGAAVRAALADMTAHIVTLHRDGYPHRARGYASALLPLLSDVRDNAPLIFSLQSLAYAPVSVQEPSMIPVLSEPVSLPVDPQELIIATTEALRRAGFMMTSQTVLSPEATTVTISDIVLGTPVGDRLLHFSYDPATDLVSAVDRAGRTLPNSLPLEQYAEWVKGE